MRSRAAVASCRGATASDQRDYASAKMLHEQSLALCRELGDPSGVAMSLNNLGDIAYEQGLHAAARSLHEECLTIRRELGDRRGIADSLESLGYVALAQAQPDTAARLLGAAAVAREHRRPTARGVPGRITTNGSPRCASS